MRCTHCAANKQCAIEVLLRTLHSELTLGARGLAASALAVACAMPASAWAGERIDGAMPAQQAASASVSAPATPASDPGPTQHLSLPQVWQRVDEANRDVAGARRAVQAASADVTTARVTPPAQLSWLTQAIKTHDLGHGALWSRPMDTIVRLDQPLERGDKAGWREKVAHAGLDAARADLSDQVRQQRVAASDAYWDLKLAQTQRELTQRNAELAAQSSRVAALRLRQGDLSRLESLRLQVEADRAANEQAQADATFKQARGALAQRLAWPVGAALQASDAWPDVALPLPPSVSDEEQVLAQRADVLAAQRRLEQAEAAVSLAQAQRKTDVTVSLQFEHDQPDAPRTWGVGVSVPLGMDGRQEGPVTRALVARDDAADQLARVRAQVQLDRAQQMASLDAARARVRRLLGEVLPQARQAVEAAQFAREQGAMSLQDVLDARRVAHAVELESVQAQADFAKAYFNLLLSVESSGVNP